LVRLCACLAAGVIVSAQAEKVYQARLSPVPIDVTMMSTIAGSGSITATVRGQTVTFSGTFSGLRSPATTAILHKAQRGTRGPQIGTLQIAKATSGEISGSVPATPQLLQDLERSMIYVQIQSEKAPDGNLWGWLLVQDKKR
jgi:hypothetical protein